MDLSYLLYGGSCLSHSLMDLSYLLYEGVVYHIA